MDLSADAQSQQSFGAAKNAESPVCADDSPNTKTISEAVKATVKWFNTLKGFGFVVPEGTRDDAFIHISLLEKKGLSSLGEGQTVLCTVEKQSKGHQVTELLDVLTKPVIISTADGKNDNTPASDGAEDEEDMRVVGGQVKWYRPEKGYGFIAPDDGEKDIFVHKKCLDMIGLSTLEPGQKFDVQYKLVPKGREAVVIQKSD